MKTKNMDIAMILVRTIGFLSLNVTVEVEICGKLFKVRLTEDTHNPLRISFNLTKQEVKMVDSSSDSKVDWNKGGDVNGEAKFNESLMEESLFSDDIKVPAALINFSVDTFFKPNISARKKLGVVNRWTKMKSIYDMVEDRFSGGVKVNAKNLDSNMGEKLWKAISNLGGDSLKDYKKRFDELEKSDKARRVGRTIVGWSFLVIDQEVKFSVRRW
ncbi:unnamed protein product [Vicia faba]|uniref:Uncharacterized protein n=1 Tax=Vicia faba TaxID=3906 RepID=A0AAV0ZZN0_VICFA|nr:unnamed protein product [Vicia faba]